jgi:hypothetical protein
VRLLASVAVLAALAACDTPSGPDPTFTIEPIQITGVEVLVDQPEVGKVSAHVTGYVGNGCTELYRERVVRDRDEVFLTIERRRELADVCTEIARLYDETRVLPGEFGAGSYRLVVNDLAREFSIP